MIPQDLAHVYLKGSVGDQFFSHPQAVASSRHLRHAAESELRHDLTDLLCDKEHESADIFRFALEAAPQRFVLCRDAHRAGILGTDSHHHASETYQRCCRKTKFFRAEQRRDRHVPAAHELAVCLQNDSVPKTVFREASVRLCETKLPGKTCVMYGASRRRAGSSVITRDQDHLCTRFRDAGCDGAYACLGDQFDIDPGVSVGVLEVIDKLCQIFDRINIVMGRRRDQRNAGSRESCLCHPRIHFFARKMSAFARLSALGHLDLDLFRAAQILAGDAEPARGHLLDLAVLLRSEARPEFSSLTGVGAGAYGVHGDRQRLVRLGGEGTVAHGTGLEVLDDLLCGLHFLNRNCAAGGNEFQKSAKCVRPSRVIHEVRVGPESLVGVLPHCSLQCDDRLRAVHMVLFVPAASKVMETDRIQCLVYAKSQRVKGVIVAEGNSLLDLLDAYTAHPAHCSGKIPIDHILAQTDRLENAGGLVGLESGNAHLGRYFDNAE